MASFISLPRELRDDILHHILLAESPVPSGDDVNTDRTPIYDVESKSWSKQNVLYEPRTVQPMATALMLVNRQLQAETQDALGRIPGQGMVCKVDLMLLKERGLWVTFVHVPRRCKIWDQVNVKIRPVDVTPRSQAAPTWRCTWEPDYDSPPTVVWPFYYALERFLKAGPTGVSAMEDEDSVEEYRDENMRAREDSCDDATCDEGSPGNCGSDDESSDEYGFEGYGFEDDNTSVDRHIFVKCLVLDFVSPAEGETPWRYIPELSPRALTRISTGARLLPHREPANSRRMYIRPTRLAEFFAKYLRVIVDNHLEDMMSYGSVVLKRVGFISIRVDGEPYDEIDLGVLVGGLSWWGIPYHSSYEKQAAFKEWHEGVLASRRVAGLGIGEGDQ
ncbi:hypothetical protein PG995_011468 [Apiospora arundinis]